MAIIKSSFAQRCFALVALVVVAACSSKSSSPSSSGSEPTPEPRPQPPPISATATPQPCAIRVSWTSTRAFTGFDVQGVPAPSVPVSTGYGLKSYATELTLTGLTGGVAYNVVVFGWKGQGISAQAAVQATPLPCNATDAGPMDATTPVDATTPSDSGSDASRDSGSDAGADAGGPAWTFQQPDARGRDLSAVWGSSAADVYVVGIQGAVYHSTNDGVSWQPMTVGTSGDQFSGIWGTSASNIYAVSGQSNGIVYRWDGQTWGTVATVSQALFGVWGSGPSDVYAVGAGGTVLHSTDGTTFTPQASGTTTNLLAIGGSSASDVFAVGGMGGVAGIILHSNGSTWTGQYSTPIVSQALDGVWAPSSNVAYVANLQANALVATVNDGALWSAGAASPGTGGGGLYGIWGSSASDFYVAGATATGALIAHGTGPGALTAEPLPATTVGDGFSGVWGSSAGNVYAVGAGGRIAHKH